MILRALTLSAVLLAIVVAPFSAGAQRPDKVPRIGYLVLSPLVVVSLLDPVEEGLVTSLARPGGNLTGSGWSTGDLAGKRLELLKEAIPKLSHVAILWTPSDQASQREWQVTQSAAQRLRVTLRSLEVRDPSDVPKAFAAMTQKRPEALLTFASPLTTAYRPIIIEFARKQR